MLAHFDRLAEAPGAVARLRRFILDLAVRGKLVTQDAGDEHASALLKKIESEIARLVKIGEMRKPKALPPIEAQDEPFDAPTGWRWVRIRQVTADRGQTTPVGEFTYIDVGSINKEAGVLGEHKVLSANDAPSRARKIVCKGDVLYSCVRPTLLNIAVVEDEINPRPIASTAFAVLNSFGLVLPRYLWIALRSPYLEAIVESGMRGQAYPAINDAEFALLPLALPPLAEQHRIVAKVDELMALCDQLEAAQQERERRRDSLAAASLQRLNQPVDATNPETQREHARFHLHHLPRLTTRPEHIKAMWKAILNFAVRGRLVLQDDIDVPASKALVTASKPFNAAESFAIPSSWAWRTVGDIAETRLGKMLDKAKNKGRPKRYLRNVNVRWFDFDLSDVYEMRFEDTELDEFELRQGDVLICEGGEPGRVAVWDERESDIYFQKAIHRVRFPADVNPHYFANVLREAADSKRLETYFTGVGIKHFTGRGLASFLVPLPPLAEQHRIVAKVDELMALCDQLETQLSTTQTDSRRLLEAVLDAALAPT